MNDYGKDLINALIPFAKANGWQMAIIAVSGILILGLLKSFKLFNWLKPEMRANLYPYISAGISCGGAGAYLFYSNAFQPLEFASIAITIWGLNQIAYKIVYEKTGFKKNWKKVLNWVSINFFKIDPEKLYNSAKTALENKKLVIKWLSTYSKQPECDMESLLERLAPKETSAENE